MNKLLSLLTLFSFFLFNVSAQNCPSYSSTVSSGNTACANQTYYFKVDNTSCPGTITFNVNAAYASFGYEIDWEITSNLTGNVVASAFGTSNGTANVTVGPLSVATQGQIFTLNVYDSWGDGLSVGGFVNIVQAGVTLVSITGDFGDQTTSIFGPTINISAATLTITTPSGNVVETVQSCKNFSTPIILANNNFCNTISVDLPWTIRCNVTNAVLSSGIKNIIVHPKVPTGASDLVTINWNTASCAWDVSPQNDCDNLDIGSIFSISPSPGSLNTQACANKNQNFTVAYAGMPVGPSCCATGGPLVPISYSATNTYTNFVATNSPFGGINNSAYSQIPANSIGGAATSISLNVNMTGYAFPLASSPDHSYWVTIYVDGNPIYDTQFQPSSPNFNQTFTLANIPGGYDENSVVEVYIYPNSFSSGTLFTTYVPNGGSNPGLNNWSATNLTMSLTANFTELAPTATNCSFAIVRPVVCCTPTVVADVNTTSCSGGTSTLSSWTGALNAANVNCLVFSSVTPVAGTTLPNNIFPNGINTTCATVNQVVKAYAYCDANNSGSINAGDTYTLLSTFTLAVYPAAPTLSINNGGCGIAPTATLVCNGTNLSVRTGTAPISTPCGVGVNTTNLSGTFTANDIALLYGAPASCYSDITYNITSSCTKKPISYYNFNQNICATGSIIINGTTYNASNLNGTETMIAANGCDSIITVNITLVLPDTTFATATSCNPANVGVLFQNLTNIVSCDSVHKITTTLLLSDSTFASATSCNPANVGIAFQNLTNLNGCDSIHKITTTLLSSDSTFANATSCIPANVGIVFQNLTNLNGCDSIHKITTTLLASDSTFTNTTSCLPANVGIVFQNLTNLNGCDSIHKITTTFSASDSTFANATSCNPNNVGIAYQNLINKNGCDSIHKITTTLLASDATFANATSCNPSNVGVVVQNLINKNGCDSIHQITTTLLLSSSTFENLTSCNPSDTGVVLQTLTNVNGCDSVHTITTAFTPFNVDAVATPDEINEGESVVLSSLGDNATSYAWTNTAGDITSILESFSTVLENSTTFYLTTNYLNCTDVDSVNLTVNTIINEISLPDAFSPNDDGLNDDFGVINYADYDNIALRVYDRWGQMIFSSEGKNPRWNGTFKNVKQTLDVYNYYIEAIRKDKSYKVGGSVSLLR